MKTLFTTSLLIVASVTFAVSQNITTANVSWSSQRLFNATSGDIKEEAHQFLSTGNTSVEWKAQDGTSKVFQVQEVLGQWSDVAASGEIVYEVKRGNERGTITFLKNADGTFVRLLLIDDAEAPPSTLEFKISTVQIQ